MDRKYRAKKEEIQENYSENKMPHGNGSEMRRLARRMGSNDQHDKRVDTRVDRLRRVMVVRRRQEAEAEAAVAGTLPPIILVNVGPQEPPPIPPSLATLPQHQQQQQQHHQQQQIPGTWRWATPAMKPKYKGIGTTGAKRG